MAERARFTHDGYPANLEAAAWGALNWLRAFRELNAIDLMRGGDAVSDTSDPVQNEERATLGRCIAALSEFVAPCLPAEWERANPEAVAEIVR